jgi:hypothetical protein
VINTRNVENIVQRQLVELNDVDKEEPAKEYMGRNGNASEEESGESYPESFLGSHNDLAARHIDLRLSGECAGVAQLAKINRVEDGSHPTRSTLLLRCCIAGRHALLL